MTDQPRMIVDRVNVSFSAKVGDPRPNKFNSVDFSMFLGGALDEPYAIETQHDAVAFIEAMRPNYTVCKEAVREQILAHLATLSRDWNLLFPQLPHEAKAYLLGLVSEEARPRLTVIGHDKNGDGHDLTSRYLATLQGEVDLDTHPDPDDDYPDSPAWPERRPRGRGGDE